MVTDEQKTRAQACYGPSVDFSHITIKPSRFCSAGRPWTCVNVIRVKKGPDGSGDVDDYDLVHEYGHVWQHQHGRLVFLSALTEQVRATLWKKFDPYNYGGPDGIKPPRRLFDLYTESQAQIITEYWKAKNGSGYDRLGNLFSPDYVQNLARLVQDAGVGVTPPCQATLASRVDSTAAFVVNGLLGLFE